MSPSAKSAWWPHTVESETANDAAPPASPIGALVFRRAVYSRNGVCWFSIRAWSSKARQADIAALRIAKADVDPVVIAAAAAEVADFVRVSFGDIHGWTVSTVAVGHSRRPDSFAVRMAAAAAECLAVPFVKVFADRFVTGVSHPKEFVKLSPLARVADVAGPILLVDDVATSGWHIEEAISNLRADGRPVFAIAWISGTVK